MTSYSPTSNPSLYTSKFGEPSPLVASDLVLEIASVVPPQEPEAIVAASETTLTASKSHPWQAWKVFGSTFITIFLAELGDKTQVSTLLMSAESHAPWVVFTGAAAALITTSLLGVLVGRWLSGRLSPKTLDTAAGIILAIISVWLFWDVWQG